MLILPGLLPLTKDLVVNFRKLSSAEMSDPTKK